MSELIESEELIEILPCPFCGEAPEVLLCLNGLDAGMLKEGIVCRIEGDWFGETIECVTDECVHPRVSYYGLNVAREKWNTRSAASGAEITRGWLRWVKGRKK